MTATPLFRHIARARMTTALTALVIGCAAPAIAQSVPQTTPQTVPQTGAGDTSELDMIDVTAAPGTTTENTNSWTAQWMRSATGLVLSQKETPQSTSVITATQMRDRSITTIPQVMDAATGVTVQAFESDRINYYSRGFLIDNYQYDGVPVPRDGVWQFGDNNPDMVLYDHVEVVRGATGLMTGAGEPGASINFIRKRPTDTPQSEIAFGLASPRGVRGEVDMSGPLNASGSVRGRLIGAYDDRDGTLDGYHKTKYVLGGTLDVDIDADTLLNLGVSYQKTDANNVTWAGLPPFDSNGNLIDWDWGASLGTDWTYVDTRRLEAYASLEHVFGNGWAGRLVATHVKNDLDSQLLWISGIPDAGTGLGMNSFAGKYDGGYTQNSLNAILNGDFDAFGRAHKFVLGAMASHGEGTYYGYNVDPSWSPTVGNVFTGIANLPEPGFSSTANTIWDTTTTQYGLYGAAQFSITDRLKAIAGTRLNWWNGTESTTESPKFDYSYSAIVTPYLGFTYDINDTFTGYGSITSIYKPQLVQDAAGNYLDPTYGYNYELGVKAGLFDDRLQTSFAVFQTNQKDVANYVDYDYSKARSIYESIDGTKTQGFEIEAAGAITDHWKASLGYTYRYSRDKDGNELYTDQPRNTLKLATDYRVAGLFDDKLTVGGALRWQSGTDSMAWVSSTSTPNVHQGSYTVYDLTASWKVDDKTDLYLAVNNLFNKKYYATTGFYNTVVYGDGRTVEVTLRKRF